MKRLWLIGGTHESRILAQRLIHAQIPTVVTMTTDSARSLYPDSPLLTLVVARLSPATLLTFLQHHRIGAILDASHPFAVQISELAMAAVTSHRSPYLRFERPSLPEHSTDPLPNQPIVRSIDALLNSDCLVGQRVLLTLGYRWLHWFQPWHEKATLFARILPSVDALTAALTTGFTGDRLIALRPPVTIDLEKALWQQWQISMVITKASGVAGGEHIKQQLSRELNIQLISIARPSMDYPAQTSDFDRAITWCSQRLSDDPG